MFITKIKTEAFLVRSCVQLNQLTLPPNQSLKLTEPAVDDFAARLERFTFGPEVRATAFLAAAVRRRSLAPVR